MKEASSELSMTAIAVVAIAAIGVLFTTVIWPTIKTNITNSARCSNAINCVCNGNTCNCQYLDENGTSTAVTCPNRNN
jgi:hypothetical protein